MSPTMNLIFLLSSVCLLLTRAEEIDDKGYVMYCPCMGRFGNQADHFLGSLAFAKGLDRTLVLPPWIEYPPGVYKSIQIPFDTYFQVEPLQEYHRVITMETFMKKLAPKIWPIGKRRVFCYQPRGGTVGETCNAKDGNPFGPFWDNFNIDFDDNIFYRPLYFNTEDPEMAKLWHAKFPPKEFPVLAFTGAPATFPVREEDVPLHKYLVWSKFIKDKVETFYRENIPEGPVLGLHLRNGVDFKRACEHMEEDRKDLFASAQCLGYKNEFGRLTEELCNPPEKTVIAQVKEAVKKMKAKAVFVATDNDAMIAKFKKALKKYKVTVVKYGGDDPHVDLAILGSADHYIGNCVSSFSAFAARERRSAGKSVDFWAYKPPKHDEL